MTVAYDYDVKIRRIERHDLPGMPTGRHVRHDSRSRAYPYPEKKRGTALKSTVHDRRIPILDQGDIGDCVPNTGVGALGTDPLYGALPSGHPNLDEPEAVHLYDLVERAAGGVGYPPEDDGSDGLTLAKVLLKLGLISAYQHAFSLSAMQNALQSYPVGIGINWYDSFDSPASNGTITISPNASVRGGHELLARGIDVDARTFLIDNSWSAEWGLHGSCVMSWTTMDRLLSEQGDVTVFLPLTAPVPVPVPTPTPTPTPPGPPTPTSADLLLRSTADPWDAKRHTGANKRMQKAYELWRASTFGE